LMLHRCQRQSFTTAIHHPRIVSRRAWQSYVKQNPSLKSKNSSTSNKKKEEAPWPRNFQIAGYCAAAVGIPYSLAWFYSSNQELRDMLPIRLPDIVLNALRHHFGEIEDEYHSYPETLVQQYHHEEEDQQQQPAAVVYKFEDEPTLIERTIQHEIDSFVLDDTHEIPIKISCISPHDNSIVHTEQYAVHGSLKANADSLLNIMTNKKGNEKDFIIAVDFPPQNQDVEENERLKQQQQVDDTSTNFTIGDNGMNDMTMTTTNGKSSFSSFQMPDLCTIYSLWYSPSQGQAPQASSSTTAPSTHRMTADQMEESKLNYEIEQLQRNLKDPSCTRDMDEMQQELQNNKSKLRKLIWKRRLRLS